MFRERTAASSLFKSAGLRSFPLGVALRERPGIRFVSPQEEATTDIESGHDAPSGRFGKLKQNSDRHLAALLRNASRRLLGDVINPPVIPPPHSITSSARASSMGETSRPSALAVHE